MTARKPIRVGQSFHTVYDGVVTDFVRHENVPGSEPYTIESSQEGGRVVQRFTQSHLWFWARGFTPEPLLCSTCQSDREVRVFPRQTAVFGEEPLCSGCKAAEIRDAFSR